MFTGLIQCVGRVERMSSGSMTDLWIRSDLAKTGPLALGESIAVDGACLTVVEVVSDSFRTQAAPETLRRTTLGSLAAGSEVNLERALRLSDRLGGHLVSGHVDDVAEILEVTTEGGSRVMGLSLPPALRPLFIEKGSATLDGISLTLNRVTADRFFVQLIPETQGRTTLAHKKLGAKVNLEADLIGKYVGSLLGPYQPESKPGIQDLLQRAGFKSGL